MTDVSSQLLVLHEHLHILYANYCLIVIFQMIRDV